MIETTLILVIVTILVLLIFDFGNGMNDAANSIATIVGTRVLSFRTAALLAAFFNTIAALVFSVAVAKTVGKGIIDPQYVTTIIILAGVLGGVFWVYLTTYLGFPISASHSLIGGMVGAVIVSAGLKALILSGLLKVMLFIFLAPIIGLIGAIIISLIIFNLFRKIVPKKIDKISRVMQIISSSFFSLNHGANDAQKTIGIITLVLFVNGYLGAEFHVPVWVIIASYLTIGLGTLIGGKAVVKTMGMKLTKLRPVDGFCAETSGALTIFGCSLAGIPVSTTHVITGSISGVGIVKRVSSVRWNYARRIVWAWVFTIPTAAVAGGLVYFLLNLIL